MWGAASWKFWHKKRAVVGVQNLETQIPEVLHVEAGDVVILTYENAMVSMKNSNITISEAF